MPKERPRVGKGGHIYTPKKSRQFEKKVRIIATETIGEKLGGRLGIKIWFYVCGGKLFDVDNGIKSILDGLIIKREGKLGVLGVVEDDVIFEKITAERILVYSKREERTEIYIYPRGGNEMAG